MESTTTSPSSAYRFLDEPSTLKMRPIFPPELSAILTMARGCNIRNVKLKNQNVKLLNSPSADTVIFIFAFSILNYLEVLILGQRAAFRNRYLLALFLGIPRIVRFDALRHAQK